LSASSITPYNFLRAQSSARASAVGGIFEALPDDPSAVYYNPAAIYTISSKPLTATFLKHVLDINAGLLAYSHEFEEIGTFGVSLNYLNYGSFQKADMYGNQIGTFGANDLSFGISYSNELDSGLYYGVSTKIIYVNIETESGLAMAFDAGLIYQLPDGRTNLGFSILNAGFQLSALSGTSQELPLDIRMGINHRLRGLPLMIGLSFHHLADETDNFGDKFLNFSLGGEFYLGKYIMARIGYDNEIRRYTGIESNKKFSGFSGGVGIKLTDINVDYGLSFYGSGAAIHRFSIGLDI